ncbi:XRE family transcriptional regulator [Enterococcus avium]|uniref:XRE family transcriptional regulator n=1 Tax=Enterococcus avium TaxID=33945 RepID=UPI001F5A8195|nr:XRE family transcriptional regulator [Enterococcus avium]
MNIANNIKTLRKSHGYTQKDLADILQVKPTAISAWESGRNKPLMDKVTIMATLFGVSTSDIVGDTFNKDNNLLTQINNTTIKLEPFRQRKVYDFAKHELDEQEKNNNVVDMKRPTMKKETNDKEGVDVEVAALAAAGQGCYAFDKNNTYTVHVDAVPTNYDLAFQVSGHSMEPTFRHNEVIFVKKVPQLYNGQIGVVEINNEVFVKKIHNEGTRLRLNSLNIELNENGERLYPDFYADEKDEIYIIGKVIM